MSDNNKCGCLPGFPDGMLIGMRTPQNMPPFLPALSMAMGLPGDADGEIVRQNLFYGWVAFSAVIGNVAASGTVLNLKTEANNMSSALAGLGFTADAPPIAGIFDRARVYIGPGAGYPTQSEIEESARLLTLRITNGPTDVRLGLYSQVGTYQDFSDAAAAQQTVHNGWMEDSVPPTLVQFKDDTTTVLQAFRATTLAATARYTLLLHGVFFKSTGGDIRTTGCEGVKPIDVARAVAGSIPRPRGVLLQQLTANGMGR